MAGDKVSFAGSVDAQTTQKGAIANGLPAQPFLF